MTARNPYANLDADQQIAHFEADIHELSARIVEQNRILFETTSTQPILRSSGPINPNETLVQSDLETELNSLR